MKAIAVFDYGATHSSVQVREYQPKKDIIEKPIWLEQVDTLTAVNELGINCELVDNAFNSLARALGNFLKENKDVELVGIGNTSHAASPVYLDNNNRHAFHGFPKYLCHKDGSLGPNEDFHDLYPDADYAQTATPNWPDFLNWTKGAEALQRKYPHTFDTIRSLLFLSSYMGFKLTGEKAFDFTQLAAHGYGAKFTYRQDYDLVAVSNVVRRLGLEGRLGRELRPQDILGRVAAEVEQKYGIPSGIPVIEGFHDSLATFYLITAISRFSNGIVSSTGTWAVNMAERRFSLQPELERADVFYNVGSKRQPVRSSIFRGGDMREQYLGIVERFVVPSWKPGDKFRNVPKDLGFDPNRFGELLKNKSVLEPAFMSGIGPYGGKVSVGQEIVKGPLEDISYYHHALGMAYAIQLARAVELASRTDVPKEKSMIPFYEKPRDEAIVVAGVVQKLFEQQENITMECLKRVTPRQIWAVGLEGSPASFGTHLAVVSALEQTAAENLADRIDLKERRISAGGSIDKKVMDYVKAWEEKVVG